MEIDIGGLSKLLIVAQEQAEVYSQGLGEARILVTGERSGDAWWMGKFREDPGFMTLLHLHPQMDEYFYILQGVLTVYIDGTWHDLRAGTLPECRGISRTRKATRGTSQCTFWGPAVRRGLSDFLSISMRLPVVWRQDRSSEPRSRR